MGVPVFPMDNELRELEHLRVLVAKTSDWLWETDEQGRYTWSNPKVKDLLGFGPEEVLGKTPFDLMPPDEATRVAAIFTPIAEARAPFHELLNVNRHQSGRLVVLETSGVPILEAGVFRGYRGIDRDVTERVENERKLMLTEVVMRSAAEGIIVAGADGRISAANPAFLSMMGLTEKQVLEELPTMLAPGDTEPRTMVWSVLRHQKRWSGEGVARHSTGERFPVWLTLSSVVDEAQQVTGYIALVSDITERRAAEATIRFQATHDALTQLANRGSFLTSVDEAIGTARHGGTSVAVLFIDLDGFKTVNDVSGHGVGDLLLGAVARRLERCARRSDLVARFGGDEFTVLLGDLTTMEPALRIAKTIVQQLGRPFRVHGQDLRIGASVGIAVFPQDARTLDTLMAAADRAMYQAKRAGGGRTGRPSGRAKVAPRKPKRKAARARARSS